MQAEHVTLGIKARGNEPIFADGEFIFKNLPACGSNSGLFGGAIGAGKIDQRAVSAAGHSLHYAERPRCSGPTLRHGKTPHFNLFAERRETKILSVTLEKASPDRSNKFVPIVITFTTNATPGRALPSAVVRKRLKAVLPALSGGLLLRSCRTIR